MKKIAIVFGLLLFVAAFSPPTSHANSPPGVSVTLNQELDGLANYSFAPATINTVDVPYTVTVSEYVISQNFDPVEYANEGTYKCFSQYPGSVAEYPLRTCNLSGNERSIWQHSISYPLKTYSNTAGCQWVIRLLPSVEARFIIANEKGYSG